MTQSTRLLRGVFLALAIVLAVPFTGFGGALLGVHEARAQSGQTLVASVLFEGNSRFSDAQLLTMVDVSSRGVYDAARVQTDVESIRLAYDAAGFRNVQVSARTQPVEGGRVLVTFVVNEGERAAIKAINFTGNNSVNAGTLKGVMLTKETGILSWLLRDDTYDEQKLAVDRELVRQYYANHGFPDAQVSSVGEFDASRNAYFVNFTINEGERYQFGSIGVETSINGLDPNSLRGLIRTRENSTYSYKDLAVSAEEMSFEATQAGYSFADVRPRIDRDAANRKFNVTYLVDEGPRVYVERINITGNEKTRDFVIRRELAFAEGDPFNRNLVTRGRTSILALGYFSAVNVTAEPGSAPDKVIINIAVVEQSTGEYGVTFGYSTLDGWLGEVSLTERNFLGRGQYLRVALGATQSGKTIDFSFTEPRFMGLKLSAGIDGYHRIVDESSSNYYGYQATGGQLRFGVPIVRDVTAQLIVGAETKTIVEGTTYDDDGDPSTPEIPVGPASSLVTDGEVFNKYWVGYTLTYDGRDDPKKTTSGLYAQISQQYIGWDFNYLKSEARARYFIPLLPDYGVVGSVRGQVGIINNVGGGTVESIEAYHPGPNIIRGFGRNLGPLLTTGEPLGTTAYAAASAEIQFPLPVFPESYGLSGAFWADVAYIDPQNLPDQGTGTVDPLSIDQNLKASIGASLLWDSPFGPLRGDFAHVLSKATTDQTQVFQLTLSTLF